MSYMNYTESEARRGVLDIEAAYRAMEYANRCAGLGFVPPVVLRVAERMEFLGLRNPAQSLVRLPPKVNVALFAQLESLWEAWNNRKEEIAREKEKREEKVGKRRNAYFCAAEGCGIEATKKSGLKTCSGPCPANVKPAYCSRECQVKVGFVVKS